MKRTIIFLIIGTFLLSLGTSCGRSPKSLGKKVAKLSCEEKELREEISDLQKDAAKLDLDKEDDRGEYADIQMDIEKLNKKISKLSLKSIDIQIQAYRNYDDKEDYEDFSDEAEKAFKKEYKECD
ncbi:MAG: hypothetical protein JW801_06165 [Bacteroidales bacterium]|nr:hypothetical protein [Bacteroidales bacterium]